MSIAHVSSMTANFGAVNTSRLKYYVDSKHSNIKDKPLSYFLQLKAFFEKHKTLNVMFTGAIVQENDGTIAS